MKWIWKLCLWFTSVAVPIVIAACYGMPYRFAKDGKVVDAQTKKGIAYIDISCVKDDRTVSSFNSWEDGHFVLQYDKPCDSLLIEDIDGEENGGVYKTKSVAYDPIDDEPIIIELERDRNSN